jgi:4'-phosphopantetheinyl transferase
VITALQRPGVSDAVIRICQAEVHIWWAQLDAPESRVQQLARTLDADEVARADRFQAPHHRERWIVGRGLLRELVGQYTGCLPSNVRLVYGPHGKPSLAPDSGDSSLRFSLAHSEGLVVFALARDVEIGVDVEAVRPLKDLELVAEQFFSPRECESLRSLRPDQRVDGFFNCWSRKEAYIKALGLGLSLPLDTFDVELRPGLPARLLAVEGLAGSATSWSLRALHAPPGFAAAVAMPGQVRRICQRWLEST